MSIRVDEGAFTLEKEYHWVSPVFHFRTRVAQLAESRPSPRVTAIPADLPTWVPFRLELLVPDFAPGPYRLAPSLLVTGRDSDANPWPASPSPFRSPPRPPALPRRKPSLDRIAAQGRAFNRTLYDRPELQWMRRNRVMGFASIWDKDVYDPVSGRWTIAAYCEEDAPRVRRFRLRAFLAHLHQHRHRRKEPVGFLSNLPGGLDGLRHVAEEFRRHGVRLFISYNPWDTDTRRAGISDDEYLAFLVERCGIDGIFMDTRRNAGHVQETLDRHGLRHVAIVPETHPHFCDIHGPNAVVASWMQTVYPFDNHGAAHLKWIEPQHVQYRIQRGARDQVRTSG